MRALLFSALFLMIAGAAIAGVFKGEVRVIDGDEIEVAGKRVRLYGIEAPELGQTCWYRNKEFPCGLSARRNLWLNVKDQRLTCREKSVVDGVVVALCFDAKGRDVAGDLVRNGWALAVPKQVEVYIKAEAEAKRQKLGLWNFKFTKPWDWRAMMGEK
ncbi:MAG: thermonuclease family protein [Proteobacteria bacterium]|nr:thermonuclease family protein [Pseudomonadota bacterium]